MYLNIIKRLKYPSLIGADAGGETDFFSDAGLAAGAFASLDSFLARLALPGSILLSDVGCCAICAGLAMIMGTVEAGIAVRRARVVDCGWIIFEFRGLLLVLLVLLLLLLLLIFTLVFKVSGLGTVKTCTVEELALCLGRMIGLDDDLGDILLNPSVLDFNSSGSCLIWQYFVELLLLLLLLIMIIFCCG